MSPTANHGSWSQAVNLSRHAVFSTQEHSRTAMSVGVEDLGGSVSQGEGWRMDQMQRFRPRRLGAK